MKTCTRCGESFPATTEHFHRNRQSKDGLYPQCKPCKLGPPAHKTPQQRFWEKVEKAGLDECWEWTGARTPPGYGSFRLDGRARSAHRVSYEWSRSTSASGLVVRHSCDNPPCVNPRHLFGGTQKDNIRDAAEKGRLNGRPGESRNVGRVNGQAVLSPPEVRAIKAQVAAGRLHRDIASDFGVSRSLVSMINGGKRWGHIT